MVNMNLIKLAFFDPTQAEWFKNPFYLERINQRPTFVHNWYFPVMISFYVFLLQ